MIHLLMEARKGKLKHDTNDIDTGFATAQESLHDKSREHEITTMTDEDMVAQAMIFFFAGFDSSSNFMCYMAHELALHTDVQEKLQNEIDATLHECGHVTYDALMKMRYMDMVISGKLQFTFSFFRFSVLFLLFRNVEVLA